MNPPSLEIKLPPVRTVLLGAAPLLDATTPNAIPDSRPVLVLLHGWQKSLDALRPLGELLVDYGRVLLIDLPGFGASPLPAPASNEGGGWSTVEYAERVKQVLDDAGVSSCVLIGHSFGGRISVRLAARYPELVQGVVLIASHGIPRQRSTTELLRGRIISTLVQISKRIDSIFKTKLFNRYMAPRFGSADYIAAGALRRTLVKTVNEDLSSEASKITAPTLLLWGAADQQTPVDIARAYERLIKGSELHVFPNKGHEPYTDVGSHLLASYVSRFLHEKISHENRVCA